MYYVFKNNTKNVVGSHANLEIAKMNCMSDCSIIHIANGKKNAITKRISADGKLELNPTNPLALRPQSN